MFSSEVAHRGELKRDVAGRRTERKSGRQGRFQGRIKGIIGGWGIPFERSGRNANRPSLLLHCQGRREPLPEGNDPTRTRKPPLGRESAVAPGLPGASSAPAVESSLPVPRPASVFRWSFGLSPG